MQPFHLVRQLKKDFIDYVSSKFPFADDGDANLDLQLRAIMNKEGSLFQDPVLQLVRTRSRLEPMLDEFEPRLQETIRTLEELRNPYSHQVKAWNRINRDLGTVISTGTGSGKSESFILPILNGLLKKGYGRSRQGIGAIFIYPMNALVHDQFYRIIKYAAGTGLRVGIYNGAFKDLSVSDRKRVCDEIEQIAAKLKKDRPHLTFDENLFDPSRLVVDPAKSETIPHILLTNYKMLEYMLLRSGDQKLFDDMDLKYLVLDEAHTYTGTLALEVACLLNRLKVHLGGQGRSYVPVATSATLSQGGDVSEGEVREEMRTFFSRLFGCEIENSEDWLLKDEYTPLIKYDVSKIQESIRVSTQDPKGLLEDLEAEFPESLFRLAKRFAKIEVNEYQSCAHGLVSFAREIAPHLLSLLLKEESGRESTMIKWADACQRFKDRAGGRPETLEALLILMSHSFENERFPEIGLRYHLFGRAQPRIYWTIDKKTLLDDQTLPDADVTALNFVSCRKCGHSGWAGLIIADNDTAAERWELRPLPERFDEENLSNGTEAAVFHDPASLPDDGEHLASSWNLDRYAVTLNSYRPVARFLGSNGKAGTGETTLVRVERKKRKKTAAGTATEVASDFHSCPACGSTSDERPVMNSHRSSASTDLSVHSASLLSEVVADGTSEGDNKERKLLIFCDNRQETSFLAGFLTDRHRRLNLRRAVASYLKAASDAGDANPWLLKRPLAAEDRSPKTHRYDFALRLLISIESGRYFSRTEALPPSFVFKKRTIQNLLPREVLQTDFREQANRETDRRRSLKEWLLENYTIEEAQGRLGSSDDAEFDLMEDNERSRFVLELLTDVITLDLTAVQVREGSLLTLGLATWDFPALNATAFDSFARSNPNLRLDGNGLFLLSYWLLETLFDMGAVGDVDVSTARQYLGRYKSTNLRPSLVDLLGESVANGKLISKNSQIGRILLAIGDEETLKAWSSPEIWRTFIRKSPISRFVFLSAGDQDSPLVNVVGELHVFSQVSMWRSRYTGAWRVSPARFSFSNSPTGRRAEDVWEKVEQPPHEYYRKLYHQPLSSEARLVSAMEHNGMISAADQNVAVSRFNQGAINTLVATPTLEMGVDLPDLPTVIHRSVPPDPSNYAQRAGRAGRGPKRALIFTYCGLGSHDMTFFESPLEMASGEILPPGMPIENIFIIARHLNGLILEAMGLPRAESAPIDLSSWSRLVDLSKQVGEAMAVLGDDLRLPQVDVQDWRGLYQNRLKLIHVFIEDFLQLTKANLWEGHISEAASNKLLGELRQAADLNSWPDKFQKELDGFRELVDLYLKEFNRLTSMTRQEFLRMSDDQKRSHDRAEMRAKFLIRTHLGAGQRFDVPQPISDLAANGFLPNFDFPGRVTRFRGIRVNAPGSERKFSDLLKYDRSATVALREFAPEQKIYGHGWVYEVDRYIAAPNTSLTGAGWGLCLNSCTQLIPKTLDQCPQCGGEVLKAGEQSPTRPELVEVREVHGSQRQVISDSSSKREMNYFTVDVKLVGLPEADRSFALKAFGEVRIDYHESRERSVQTLQIVQRREGTPSSSSRLGGALYREVTDGSSFAVRLGPPAAQNTGLWRPFIPAVQNESPGIVLRLPYRTALQNQWVQDADSDPVMGLEEFYKTISAVLERASQKVLRLNRRMNNLDISENRVMSQGSGGEEPALSELSLIILDTEKGGSGIIQLVDTYWDQIMDECKRLISKDCCENGCYRCLKSYDNQWDHQYIRKSIFKVGQEIPLFDALKRACWAPMEPGKGQNADSASPPESRLLHWLRDAGIDFKTQVELKAPDGTLVTVSDFEINVGQRKIQLFVDGWEVHGTPKIFLKDIEKRNFVAKRGWSTMWIPGHWPNRADDLERLKVAFSNQDPISILVRKEKRLERLPMLDQGVYDHLFSGLSGSTTFYPLQAFDVGDNLDARVLLLDEALNDLKKAYHPFAMTDEGLVLCFVNGEEIMASKSSWQSWCLMQTALASLGYRVLNAWIGSKST